jgi:hypothetical protein
VPHAPEGDIKGRIIKIYGGVAEAGPETVVAINRGSMDGLEDGHVLAISRRGHVIKDPEYVADKTQDEAKTKDDPNALKPGELRLPDERVGLLMIFRTFDRVSYGLIMQSSDAVFTLDSVHTP